METTGFNNSNRPQYENVSIPYWGFHSSCDWFAAVKVDLILSSFAIFYNIIIALLPLAVYRMNCMQGAVISSYTCGASVVSIYCVILDIRLLESGKQQLENEKYITYLLIWLLCYYFVFHLHLLSWNQHHSLTCFYAHRRFTSRSKLIKIHLVVWISAIVFALLEAFFIYNPLSYKAQVSLFRLVVMLICMKFVLFGSLVLTMTWNTMVFTFLLKVIHNGFVKEMPPESSQRNNPDVRPGFVSDPWNRESQDETYEDPPEYATLPDDVSSQLTNSFVNVIIIATFGSIMIPWISYHVLAILRASEVVDHYKFYEIIYRCELYASLYTIAKFMLLLNPLWFFYYRKEMKSVCRAKGRHGVTHE